ncbi:MAG: hypothetical protein WBO44_14345 [Saprospiraceae bacterium]
MSSENRTSNIINAIIAFGTLLAVWVSTCSLNTSNEALELTRQSIKASESKDSVYLEYIGRIANANDSTAKANQATSISNKESALSIKKSADANSKLANSFQENLEVNKEIFSNQIKEYNRLANKQAYEDEPFLKVIEIKPSKFQIGDIFELKIHIRYYGKAVLVIDSSFFYIEVYTPKSSHNMITYLENVDRNFIINECVNEYPGKKIFLKDSIIEFQIARRKGLVSCDEFNNMTDHFSGITVFGDIYYNSYITGNVRRFTFNCMLQNTTAVGEKHFADLKTHYEVNANCSFKKKIFIPEFYIK